MAGLLRFFRPILEWLEARFAPAVALGPAPPEVQQAFFLAPPPEAPPAFGPAAADPVFTSGGLLPYLDDGRIAPGLAAEQSAAAAIDAVFLIGALSTPPTPPLAVTDSVFASGFRPTHALFDFTPPPPPKGLPPTQPGAADAVVQPLELAALPRPVDFYEQPDGADTDAADADEPEVVTAA